jgi:hypothetical protein
LGDAGVDGMRRAEERVVADGKGAIGKEGGD